MDYSQLPASDLALACLKKGDEPAWIEFVRRFQPVISSVAYRTARLWGEGSPEVVEDLVQETFLKICTDRRALADKFQPYRPEAIFGYLKVLTTNLVHDHFRAVNSSKRGKNLTSSVEDESVFASREAPCTIEQDILISQIDASLRDSQSPFSNRDRNIFWLHYRMGLSASSIAANPRFQLSTKGVESTLFRLTKYVKARLLTPFESRPQSSTGKGIRAEDSFSKE